MRAKATLIIGSITLAVCLVCPLVEMFDQWDHTLQTGNDTEYLLVLLGLCVGAAIALGRLVVTLSPIFRVSSVSCVLQSALSSLPFSIRPAALAFSSAGPPFSLRI